MPLTFRALIACAVAVAALLTGCSGSDGSHSGTDGHLRNLPIGDEITTTADPALTKQLPKDITDKGRIEIAVDIPYPPMSMYGADNRELGFDPELARLIGQKLDIDVKLNKAVFDTFIASLQARRNDLIMASMSDTTERQQTLNFVDYMNSGYAIVVKKGNPDGITSQQALCGKVVAVQKATLQSDILRAMNCGIEVVELPADLDALTALRAGKSQAYVSDAIPARYIATTTDGGNAFDVVNDPVDPRGFSALYTGIGVLKDRTELTDAVRAALQALIDDGTYHKLLERYSITAYGVESAKINQGGSA